MAADRMRTRRCDAGERAYVTGQVVAGQLSHVACAGISRPDPDRRGEEHTMSAHETPAPKRIACGDVVPGCTFTASAPTEEELLEKVAAHVTHDHGLSEVTPELAATVKAAIKSQ